MRDMALRLAIDTKDGRARAYAASSSSGREVRQFTLSFVILGLDPRIHA